MYMYSAGICHSDMQLMKKSPHGQAEETVQNSTKNCIDCTLLRSPCFRPTREKESLLAVWWYLSSLVSVCAGCQSSKVILV